MAVKMRLTKAPTLQKLLVVTLLTLSGLGFPPPLTSATDCYQCGRPTSCSAGSAAMVSCPGKCKIAVKSGQTEKDCAEGYIEKAFPCVQQALGQSGSCISISTEEEVKKAQACLGAGSRQGGPGTLKACLCDTDLCNTDSLLGGGPGPVGPGGGGSKIKCFCQNQGRFPDVEVTCSGNGEVECGPQYKACNSIKGPGGEVKGCDKDGFFGFGPKVFECVQKEHPSTSGACVKGTPRELRRAARDCAISSGGPFTARDGGDEVVEMCTCKTELCNSPGGGSSGTGQGLLAGRYLIQVGITGAMITLLLVINGLYE